MERRTRRKKTDPTPKDEDKLSKDGKKTRRKLKEVGKDRKGAGKIRDVLTPSPSGSSMPSEIPSDVPLLFPGVSSGD